MLTSHDQISKLTARRLQIAAVIATAILLLPSCNQTTIHGKPVSPIVNGNDEQIVAAVEPSPTLTPVTSAEPSPTISPVESVGPSPTSTPIVSSGPNLPLPTPTPSLTPVAEEIRFATWNMEWLAENPGAGKNPRNKGDYSAITQVLSDLDADIIAVQEVESSKTLRERVLEGNLGGKSYRVATNGEGIQEVGVIWNPNRADITPIKAPSDFNHFTRTPFFAHFHAGSMDGTIVVVHLKAGSDEESIGRRKREMQELQDWMEKYLSSPKVDRDLIVLGDFNHNPNAEGESISPKLKLFVPKAPTFVYGGHTIDLFLTSKDFAPQVIAGGIQVKNTFPIKQLYHSNNVSDHWPVTLDVKPAN